VPGSAGRERERDRGQEGKGKGEVGETKIMEEENRGKLK